MRWLTFGDSATCRNSSGQSVTAGSWLYWQRSAEAGITQRELARRLDRAHSYVSRIEKGDRRLDVPEMIQWCEVLGAEPMDVIRRIVRG